MKLILLVLRRSVSTQQASGFSVTVYSLSAWSCQQWDTGFSVAMGLISEDARTCHTCKSKTMLFKIPGLATEESSPTFQCKYVALAEQMSAKWPFFLLFEIMLINSNNQHLSADIGDHWDWLLMHKPTEESHFASCWFVNIGQFQFSLHGIFFLRHVLHRHWISLVEFPIARE